MVNELTLPERVAILETKIANMETILTQMDNKLDDLIQFKSKGIGAVSLIGALITSGIVGVIITLFSMFKGSHL